MALITRCPKCRTAFRVVADQLRLRNGLVRCGACATVFDGRACLEGAGQAPAPSAQPPAPLSMPPAPFAPPPVPTPVPSASFAQPSVPLSAPPAPFAPPAVPVLAPAPPASFALPPAAPFVPEVPVPAFDPGLQPSSLAAAPAVVAASPVSLAPPVFKPPAVMRGRDRRLPELDPDPDPKHAWVSESDVVDQALEDDEPLPIIRAIDADDYLDGHGGEPEFTLGDMHRQDGEAGEPADASIRGDLRAWYSSAAETGRALPEFLDQGLIDTQRRMRRIWAWLCLLALLVLAGQLAYVYRTLITSTVPTLRPAFAGVCKVMGCKVGYARRIERIWIESASLRMTPLNGSQAGTPVGAPTDAQAGTPAAADASAHMVLGAVLRNRYEKEQEWPALALNLRDKSDTIIARKIIPPKDYLPPGSPDFMAPGAEVTVSVPIVVTGLQVNGYDLNKFFP